jgi:hypothetical protein
MSNEKLLMLAAVGLGVYYFVYKGGAASVPFAWQYPDGTIVTTATNVAPYDSTHGGQAHLFVGPIQ